MSGGLAFDLRSMPNSAFITIHDAEGRLLDNIKLGQTKGQYVWDTRALAPGMYQITLYNSGLRVHAEKLIVKP